MKKIYSKQFKKDKFLEIINYKKEWVENSISPFIELSTNGWRNTRHMCCSINLTIGYTVINYTNYDYQNSKIIKIAKLLNKITRRE